MDAQKFSLRLKRIESSKMGQDEVDKMWLEIRRILKSNDSRERARGFLALKTCARYQSSSLRDLCKEIVDALREHDGDWTNKQEVVRLLLDSHGREEDLKSFIVDNGVGELLVVWMYGTDAKEHLTQVMVRLFKRGFGALEVKTVERFVKKLCEDFANALAKKSGHDLKCCMRIADVLVRYGKLPNACIDTFNMSMCQTVNVQSSESWRIMQTLFRSQRGIVFQYSLLTLLDKPSKITPERTRRSVLRGAVFFTGMSAWGSQRIESLRSPFSAILPSLRDVLKCDDHVVMYEVLLSIQRLVKKYGNKLRVEWDVIFDILKSVKGCVLGSDRNTNGSRKSDVQTWEDRSRSTSLYSTKSAPRYEQLAANATPENKAQAKSGGIHAKSKSFKTASNSKVKSLTRELGRLGFKSTKVTPKTEAGKGAPGSPGDGVDDVADAGVGSPSVSSSKTTTEMDVPRPQFAAEIVKMIASIHQLYKDETYFGSDKMFHDCLECYLSILSGKYQKLLIDYKLELSHPANLNWLEALKTLLEMFFLDTSRDTEIRLLALDAARQVLFYTDHAFDEEFTSEIISPFLCTVYNDPDRSVRKAGIGFLIETARDYVFSGFDDIIKILENTVLNSDFKDAKLYAMNGVTSLLSSTIDNVPAERPAALIELVFFFLNDSNVNVRQSCLKALLHLRANSLYQFQWCDYRIRTSPFLYCATQESLAEMDFIVVVQMPRLFSILVERLVVETDITLLNMTLETVRAMLRNKFIVRTVTLGPLVGTVRSTMDRLLDGTTRWTSPIESSILGESPIGTPQRTISPGESGGESRGGNAVPAKRDKEGKPSSATNLYRMLLSPLTSPVNTPGHTPAQSPTRNRIEHTLTEALVSDIEGHEGNALAMSPSVMSDSAHSELNAVTAASGVSLCLEIFSILIGGSKLLPFGKQVEVFESLMGILLGKGRDEKIFSSVQGTLMNSHIVRMVLTNISMQIAVAPDVTTQHLGTVIHSLRRFSTVVSKLPATDDVSFVALMNFCSTILSSCRAAVGKQVTENYFLDVINIILSYLAWLINFESSHSRQSQDHFSQPSRENLKVNHEYLLTLTYHSFAVCVTACPQHLRVDHAPSIKEALEKLKKNCRDTRVRSLIDVLLDLVSRYTYMTVNMLPLSLPHKRTGDNDFMFPAKHTVEKSYICGTSIMTLRMGIRGVNEMTVRGPTGASQWLMQSQQESLSVALHPLLRLMPATLMHSIAAFHQRRFTEFKNHRLSPYFAMNTDSPQGGTSANVRTSQPPNILSSANFKDVSLQKRKEFILGHGGKTQSSADEKPRATRSSPPLIISGPAEAEQTSTATARSEKAVALQKPESFRNTVPQAWAASEEVTLGCSPETSVSGDNASPSLATSEGENGMHRRISGGSFSSFSEVSPFLGPKIPKESRMMLMEMDLGPPKSRFRARTQSEGQTSEASDAFSFTTNSSWDEKHSSINALEQANEGVSRAPLAVPPQLSGSLGMGGDQRNAVPPLETDQPRSSVSKTGESTDETTATTLAAKADVKSEAALPASIGLDGAAPAKAAVDVMKTEDKGRLSVVEEGSTGTARSLASKESSESTESSVKSPPNGPAEEVDSNQIMENLRKAPPNVTDPSFIMSYLQSFGSKDDVKILTAGEALNRALTVLDRTPCAETHKIGVIYVPKGKRLEADILSASAGSAEFLSIMVKLGHFVKLSDCEAEGVYTGGLDCRTGSDGEYSLAWRNECSQVMFHCTILMSATHPGHSGPNTPNRGTPSRGTPSRGSPVEVEDGKTPPPPKRDLVAPSPTTTTMLLNNKKRHVGNDNVHIVYNENSSCEEFPYKQDTISGQFNYVHIIIRPLDAGLFRVDVRAKPGVPPFGPLGKGSYTLSMENVAPIVRDTAIQADLACRFLRGSESDGSLSNTMERFVQIDRIGYRLTSSKRPAV